MKYLIKLFPYFYKIYFILISQRKIPNMYPCIHSLFLSRNVYFYENSYFTSEIIKFLLYNLHSFQYESRTCIWHMWSVNYVYLIRAWSLFFIDYVIFTLFSLLLLFYKYYLSSINFSFRVFLLIQLNPFKMRLNLLTAK